MSALHQDGCEGRVALLQQQLQHSQYARLLPDQHIHQTIQESSPPQGQGEREESCQTSRCPVAESRESRKSLGKQSRESAPLKFLGALEFGFRDRTTAVLKIDAATIDNDNYDHPYRTDRRPTTPPKCRPSRVTDYTSSTSPAHRLQRPPLPPQHFRSGGSEAYLYGHYNASISGKRSLY